MALTMVLDPPRVVYTLCCCCCVASSHLKRVGVVGPGRRRLTSTGKLEREPLQYTSTLNVNIK